jgi:site-specific DNA-methyltransferase (adenine-specific)
LVKADILIDDKGTKLDRPLAEARVLLADTFEALKKLPDNSLDAVITDPPYFLDGMGDTWSEDTISRKQTQGGVVASLHAGMKFDKSQGIEFQRYMNELAKLAYDKIKPGGWFISFSAPRLYHRLAVGVEDAGYEIRDMWQWLYTQNQMKAMGLTRGLEKIKDELNAEQYAKLAEELLVWKTPQVKSCFEPIVMAQKPREGTFLNNWNKYHIGLINVKSGVGESGNMDTANVMTNESIAELIDSTFLVGKPTKAEKGEDTKHVSVKPLDIMRHIVRITVPEGGLVLDPFNGSGTTGIAALLENRNFLGYEKAEEYFIQSKKRNEAHFEVEFNEKDKLFIARPKKS